MNLKKLFEMQKQLDDRIVKEHGLEGQDLLPQKILALQVELGECANEWRGFKFWSKNQRPNTEEFHEVKYPCRCVKNNDPICTDCMNTRETIEPAARNPLLEEYIDCLHFILSIGLKIENVDIYDFGISPLVRDTTADTFLSLFDNINGFYYDPDAWGYEQMFNKFAGLGQMLGFTWDQIEEAYISKNQTNHQRQDTGY